MTRKRTRVKKGTKRICGAGVSIMCYRMMNDARPTTVALENASWLSIIVVQASGRVEKISDAKLALDIGA